jgi:uncharacterized coiled-coil DUF342 family protein
MIPKEISGMGTKQLEDVLAALRSKRDEMNEKRVELLAVCDSVAKDCDKITQEILFLRDELWRRESATWPEVISNGNP